MTEPLPPMIEVPRKPRWHFVFTPQATSLLLVIAVALLSYVTLQSKTASDAARTQAIQNRTIITRQDEANKAAVVRAQRQAVEIAKLARDTAADLLEQVAASNATSDVKTAALVQQIQGQLAQALADLAAAVSRLQQTLDTYAERDAERDQRRNSPAPTFTPRPTCLGLPVVGCLTTPTPLGER